MTEHLTLDDLIAILERIPGGRDAVRDWGLLESALARPQATIFGEDAYPTLHHQAAALLQSLVSNHALIDGNKRLGWLGVRLFYTLNRGDLRAPEDEAYDLVIAIADGSLTDVERIAGTLVTWVVTKR